MAKSSKGTRLLLLGILIRKKSGKREEHRKIDVLRSQTDSHAAKKIHYKTVQHGKDNAREEVNIKAGCTPLLFQRGADEIIEIKSNDRQEACAGRNKDKGNQPPDLPVKNIIGVEHHVGQDAGIDRIENPHGDIRDGEIPDQIRDTEIRVLQAEQIDPFFHKWFTPSFTVVYHTIFSGIFP